MSAGSYSARQRLHAEIVNCRHKISFYDRCIIKIANKMIRLHYRITELKQQRDQLD